MRYLCGPDTPQGGLGWVRLWTCSGPRERDWMGYLCGPALAPGRGTGWGTFMDLLWPQGEGLDEVPLWI